MNSLIHNLKMRHDSWHARWYHHWVNLGGKEPLRENLCHYVRVLLLWAPLRWIFLGKIKGVSVGTSAFALYITFLAYLTSVYVGAAFSTVVLTWAAGRYFGHRQPERIQLIAQRFEAMADEAEDWKVSKWYAQARYLGRTPFQLTLLLVVVAGFAAGFIFVPAVTLKVIAVIVGIGIALGLVVGVVIIIEKVQDRRRAREALVNKPKTRLGRIYSGLADTVKLGITYLSTKKRGSRICPFIDFEKPAQADSSSS